MLLLGFLLILLLRWHLAWPTAAFPLLGSLLGETMAFDGQLLPEFYNQLLVLMTAAAWKARTAAIDRARILLLFSTLFAAAFVAVKAVEYRGEIALGLVPAVNTFLATYYTLTGLHALDVIGGMIANLWIMAGVRRVGTARTV